MLRKNVRWISLVLIVGALTLLAAITAARRPRLLAYQHSTSVPAARYDIRTAGGSPLASIFEGVTGSALDPATVNALVAEAKAPLSDPCHKNEKSSWSIFLDVFTPPSVFAQCDSDCTTHYNSIHYVNSDCLDLTVCTSGPVYYYGCQGQLFDCGDGGFACGQTTCYNP